MKLTRAQIAAVEAIIPNSFWDEYVVRRNVHDREFRPFEQARAYAQSLGLKNKREWMVWTKSDIPPDIPKSPSAVYLREWKGWEDWLGNEFLSFENARAVVRSLGITTSTEWLTLCSEGKRPLNVPSNPCVAYSARWLGWKEFLGTGTKGYCWLPFEEARAKARSLGLKSGQEWQKWWKTAWGAAKPNIPATPHNVYKEWAGVGDFLGTKNVRKKQFRPFAEARAFARSLGLRSKKDWADWCKSDGNPDDIPVAPFRYYPDWKNWKDWLGSTRSFEDAKAWVQTSGIKSCLMWREWITLGKIPNDIPRCPHTAYEEWADWGDFLGTGHKQGGGGHNKKPFLSFEEARAYVRSLGLTGGKEWRAWCKSDKRRQDIPTDPARRYEEWAGFEDWLNTTNVRNGDQQYLPFEEAREFARSLSLKSKNEWAVWSKSGVRPKDTIPSDPPRVYEEWKGWGDWLGTGNMWGVGITRKQFLSFEEARAYVRSLGLAGGKEWRAWCKSDKRRQDIPTDPASRYEEWAGFADWLGYEPKRKSRRK